MMDLVRVENQWSRPRSSETLAKIASRIAGTTAMTLNRLTIRTWNCAPATWRRRASHSPVTCQAMIITMASTSTRLSEQHANHDEVGRHDGGEPGQDGVGRKAGAERQHHDDQADLEGQPPS